MLHRTTACAPVLRHAAQVTSPANTPTTLAGHVHAAPLTLPVTPRTTITDEVLDQTSVLIVDDYALHRENLASTFATNGAGVVTVAWDPVSLGVALQDYPPDVILLNLSTRDGDALLREVFTLQPDARVIVLGISEDDEAEIVTCAELGVAGYHLLTDSFDDLMLLVRRVSDGESLCSPRISAILLRRLSTLAAKRRPEVKELALTSREDQILRLLDLGLSNKQIADQLCIAIHTVKNHVHSVLTKLDVRSRAEAVARYRTMAQPGPHRLN